MCKYYSSCNEYVPSRDILKIFVSILRDITDNKYKLGVLSSIFINKDGISYFIKHVYSKNDDDILYDRKTENTLSKKWITQNVNSPKIILRNLIYFFNNPYITINNLSGDIYDFSDKNFTQILETVSDGKDISILNFRTKRDKEYQMNTLVSPERKSRKKSHKKNEPKPCKSHQYRASNGRCRNKEGEKPKRKSPKRKSPKRKSPKRKSPKRKSPKRKSPKPCKDHQYRNPETNRCKNKQK
jgi:penicillin-insensitive murein endopeptidase